MSEKWLGPLMVLGSPIMLWIVINDLRRHVASGGANYHEVGQRKHPRGYWLMMCTNAVIAIVLSIGAIAYIVRGHLP
jgi:hypothetical protein